jgi:hypothetical protein
MKRSIQPGSNQKLQRLTDEIFRLLSGPAFFPRLLHGFMGVDLFVAERNEREDGVVDPRFFGGRSVCGAGGFPCGGDADFIFQFDDDPLGGFFANAFGFREETGVGTDHGGFEIRDADAAEHIERGLGADPADVIHQQAEKIALGGAHEAVEDVCVFADLEMR